MQNAETIEQAAEYVRIVLPLMIKNRVAPTPLNYAIWYEYVTGRNRELKEEVDRVVGSALEFSEDISAEIYQRYLAQEDAANLNDIREGLRKIFTDLLDYVMRAGTQTSGFGNVLETYSMKLMDSLDVEEIRKIVQDVLSETRIMKDTSDELKQRLEETTNELGELKKEFERVRRESVTDPLTGISNRKAFDDFMRSASFDASANDTPLTLLLIDIDFFKKVNDTYGHLVGDEVLRMTAFTIKQCVRGADMVARYGGEEFAVVFPSTPLKGAVAGAENIRSRFETQRFKRKATGEALGKITVSIGVSEYRKGEALTDCIQRADEALYRAKQEGRNRVASSQ